MGDDGSPVRPRDAHERRGDRVDPRPRRPGRGVAERPPRGAGRRPGLAIPATLFGPALRWWWTPTIPRITAERNLELVRVAWAALRRVWEPTALAALVGGLVPLALLGALQPKAREHLRRYGISLALLDRARLPGLAQRAEPARRCRSSATTSSGFCSIPCPLLLAAGAGRARPLVADARPAAWRLVRRAVRSSPRRLAVAVIALPFVLVDRYRRVDLQSSRDGPLVLTLCRETWKMATRLASGDEVVLDPESSRFLWFDSDGGAPTRMRWFLREGWGPLAHYDTGPVLMRAPAATVLLPVLGPTERGGAAAHGVPVARDPGPGRQRPRPGIVAGRARGDGAVLPHPRALSRPRRQPRDRDVSGREPRRAAARGPLSPSRRREAARRRC